CAARSAAPDASPRAARPPLPPARQPRARQADAGTAAGSWNVDGSEDAVYDILRGDLFGLEARDDAMPQHVVTDRLDVFGQNICTAAQVRVRARCRGEIDRRAR